jgi:uncharacterized protein (DUF433 family)
VGAVRHGRIVPAPEFLAGKPVIRGTRATVEFVLDELGRGMPDDGLLAHRPRRGGEDVLAALRFAADWRRLQVPR